MLVKFLLIFIGCFMFTSLPAQKGKVVSIYLLAQYDHTLYDYTLGNNPWGAGVGLQTFFRNRSKLQPTVDLTADIYLENDKVLRSNPNGSFPVDGNDVRGMINLFAGASFSLLKNAYVSFVAGPSFIGGQTLLGVKPSLGIYFSKAQKWSGKISFINVFNRTKIVDDDFGSLSLTLARKLF